MEEKKQGGRRPGAGRPRLSDEERQKKAQERRRNVLARRLIFDVEEESIVERINLAAASAGISRSEWLREAVMLALNAADKEHD